MKRLIVVRHGKSSWEHDVRDHDRPLKERGINDGHLIGAALKKLPYRPDEIWTSTAARALQTATLVVEHIDYNLSHFKLVRDLYTFSYGEQLNVIQSCTDDIETLMIFSHNHGLTDLVNELGSRRFDNVPTTGLVIIEFEIEHWSEVESGETVMHMFPKELKS